MLDKKKIHHIPLIIVCPIPRAAESETIIRRIIGNTKDYEYIF